MLACENQLQTEWRLAHHYLDGEKSGHKLKRLSYIDPIDDNYFEFIHSYLKTPQGLLQLAEKGEYLGEGTYARVKLSIDEAGKKFAVKIINIDEMSESDREVTSEIELAKDLGLVTGSVDREDKKYIIYKYLGITLSDFMSEHTLSRDAQYDLAIKVACAVDELHSGTASELGCKYAHLDLKPENITLDEEGEVHLIDFGFARVLDQTGWAYQGTLMYLPVDRASASKQQLDVFALLRTLYMPPAFSFIDFEYNVTTAERDDEEELCIFDDDTVMTESDLMQFLGTSSGVIVGSTMENLTALDVAVFLQLCKDKQFNEEQFAMFCQDRHAAREWLAGKRNAEKDDVLSGSLVNVGRQLLWKNAASALDAADAEQVRVPSFSEARFQ